MQMDAHLKIIGVIFMIISLIHIRFPERFNWKGEFEVLSLINKQIMYAHTFFIALFVMLNGLLFFFYSTELTTNTPLAKAIDTGLLIFWGLRCAAQHFFYSRTLWRGKKFETIIHILFSTLWVYVTLVLGYITVQFY